MTITRINEFQASSGNETALWEIMKEVKQVVLSNKGAINCQALQNQDDPTKMIVIEQWESMEAHQTAAQKIPAYLFEQAMKLVAQRPTGAYYHD